MSCNNHLKSPKNYLRKLSDRTPLLLSLSLVSITTLSATILSSITPSAHAEDSFIDKVNITVPVSCTLGSSGTTSHTGTVNNGSTVNDIGTTNLKITCNDGTGYALYAIGYTNNEYGNTNLEDASLGSSHSINTSTTISSDTSSWAMKLGRTGSTYLPIIAGSSFDTNKQSGDPDFSNYTAVPNTYQKVAYFPSSTDVGTSANGSNLTTTYRAHISQSQPMGTYKGKVKYALVHPSTATTPEAFDPLDQADCPASSICYAPNAGDVEGTMISGVANTTTLSSISSKYPTAAKQTQAIDASGNTANVTSNSTATLVAPNYKREGYGFAGWSTDFTATNSSTIYGPNETINTGDLSTNGLILYPVWIASTGNLQEFSCASSGLTKATYDTTNNKMVATLSSVTALTDSRDGNVYAVARLADNQCWMIENLRLGTDDSSDSSLAQGFGGTFAGLPATTDSWNTDNYTLAQLNTNNTNATIMGGTGLNASSALLVNTPGYPFNTSTAGQQGTTFSWYSYGNNYSWAAAIADTRAYSSFNGHTTVETSICPSGWHLPYGHSGSSSPNLGNTAGGFYYLNTQMSNDTSTQGSKDWRMFPNNFIYSGYWYGSSAGNRGYGGYYWSSSATSSINAYNLGLYSGNVIPGTSSSTKYRGLSVRCVAGS